MLGSTQFFYSMLTSDEQRTTENSNGAPHARHKRVKDRLSTTCSGLTKKTPLSPNESDTDSATTPPQTVPLHAAPHCSKNDSKARFVTQWRPKRILVELRCSSSGIQSELLGSGMLRNDWKIYSYLICFQNMQDKSIKELSAGFH